MTPPLKFTKHTIRKVTKCYSCGIMIIASKIFPIDAYSLRGNVYCFKCGTGESGRRIERIEGSREGVIFTDEQKETR